MKKYIKVCRECRNIFETDCWTSIHCKPCCEKREDIDLSKANLGDLFVTANGTVLAYLGIRDRYELFRGLEMKYEFTHRLYGRNIITLHNIKGRCYLDGLDIIKQLKSY